MELFAEGFQRRDHIWNPPGGGSQAVRHVRNAVVDFTGRRALESCFIVALGFASASSFTSLLEWLSTQQGWQEEGRLVTVQL